MSEAKIEARAMVLCNLWGQDPNNEKDWAEALDHARYEWNNHRQVAYFETEEL